MSYFGAAYGAVQVPVDHLEQLSASVAVGAEEGGLVVVGDGTIDDAAVKVAALCKDAGEVVGYAQHVLAAVQAARGHYAALAYAIVVEGVGDDSHIGCSQAGARGEVVVLVQYAFAESKSIVV